MTFLHFDIYNIYRRDGCRSCSCASLELDNFSKHCGSISQPWSFISNTNTLTVTFKSDWRTTRTGFLAIWRATTELPTYPHPPTGCENCIFPFTYLGTDFDTCISVQDVDTQPWCSASDPTYNYTPPTVEGTHIIPPPKISCSDTSCPSTSHKMVITTPDYPLSYPSNAYKVK